MLGKLYWYLKRSKKAALMLQKADKVLSTTHGTEHPLVLDLQSMLIDAQYESSLLTPS